MYTISSENLPEQFNQVDAFLALVEVRGDSVINLFKARTILKAMFDLIKEEKESEEEKEA